MNERIADRIATQCKLMITHARDFSKISRDYQIWKYLDIVGTIYLTLQLNLEVFFYQLMKYFLLIFQLNTLK